jgi:hypothetical protein
MNFNYDSWIKQAKDRLELLYEQRNAIDNEIHALEKGIEGFAPLTRTAWLGPNAGITESIRRVLSSDSHRLYSPIEIRDELLNQGVSLKQKNAMATIHQVLSRLIEKDLVKISIDKGKNRYRWIGQDGKEDVMKPQQKKHLLGEEVKK